MTSLAGPHRIGTGSSGATGSVRRVVTAWAGARIVLGLGASVAPRSAVGFWVGTAAATPAGAVLGRALGGRDLALGAVTLTAAATGAPLRTVVLACGVADAVDAVATAALRRELPPRRRGLVIAASAGSAVLAGVSAAVLGREHRPV